MASVLSRMEATPEAGGLDVSMSFDGALCAVGVGFFARFGGGGGVGFLARCGGGDRDGGFGKYDGRMGPFASPDGSGPIASPEIPMSV